MTVYYVSQGGGSIGSGSYRGLWTASQTYAVGDRVCTSRTKWATSHAGSFYIHECTTGGTASGTEPATWASTPGNTTSDGSVVWTCRACTTWANAHVYLSYLHINDAAGDIIYVKNDLNEDYTSEINLNWAGTAASPTRIICVSDSNEPPTTISTGASISSGSANNFTFTATGNYVYAYGIRLKSGASTNAANITSIGNLTAENCAFELAGNNSGSDMILYYCDLRNCTFKSSNTGSLLTIYYGSMVNCSIESGGTPGNPFLSTYTVRVIGCDFSNLSSSANLTSDTGLGQQVNFIDCKLPSSWSGSVNGATPGFQGVSQLMNSDSADTNYRLEKKTSFGTVTHETTLVRTGGATNGTTAISWRMVSNANAEWSHQTLDSPEIVKWNETTGSSITVTVEFLRDSATNLTTQDIWLEVAYLGTSGVPLASFMSDAAGGGTANVFTGYLTAAADQTDSSETWTTTGMSNPNTQKLSVSFTPQEKGFIHAVVKLAKASTTVYVDPLLTVS